MTSQHMMDDPLSLGTQYQLGTHRATYKPPPISQGISGFIFALALIIICITGIGLIVRGTFDYLDLLSRSVMIVCLGVMAILILLLVIGSVSDARQTRTLRLFLYDVGLFYVWQTSLGLWQGFGPRTGI